MQRLEQLEATFELTRGRRPAIESANWRQVLGHENLIEEALGEHCIAVQIAFVTVCEPLQELELVLRVRELDEVQDLAYVREGDEALLAEYVEDALQVEALSLGMAVDAAEEIGVLLFSVWRLSIESDLVGWLGLARILQEELDELLVVDGAVA